MVQFISFSRRLRMALNKTVSISSNCNSRYSTFTNPSVLIDKYSYENAVIALNTLQTNANTIEKSIQKQHHEKCTNVQETEKYLQRSGISMKQLDRLSVIHVSGTKGKGSTCALTESILRSFGIRTGFFSSPHLTYVTERIRINGKPISKETFTLHFWKVFDSLSRQKKHNDDMPPYFKFLTILSFHIFFAEKVDLAIIEVGIGGQYDCTNVIRNTKTVGITSLGLEHTNLLGNSLQDIAGQKAGIIKCQSNVFTVRQPLECVAVLKAKAQERNAQINWVPEYDTYKWARKLMDNKMIVNSAQQMNASLAIQLSYDWLKKCKHSTNNPEFMHMLRNSKDVNGMCLDVPEQVIIGLDECVWDGRFQIIQLGNKRLFIDGAHTMESLEVCINWFKEHTSIRNSKKCLLFNTTGDRNSNQMLDFLHSQFKFDVALFSPNVATHSIDLKDTTLTTKPLNKCLNHLNYWNELQRNVIPTTTSLTATNLNHSKVFACVEEVFDYINLTHKTDENIDLLVTGSLYLVGATLLAIEKKSIYM